MKTSFPCAILLLAGPLSVPAAVVSYSFDNIDLAVPDGSAVGLSDTRNILSGFGPIQELTVTLNLTGGFNGDLFVYLTHGSGYTVLLNRPGRSVSSGMGYSDSGISVEFNDNAAPGDVHVYRQTLFGTNATPLPGALTGRWAPDGRISDPSLTTETNPRLSLLDSFNGVNPDGAWTLFIADLDGGGVSTLRSWGLSALVVPEPGALGLLAAAGLLGWRRGRAAHRPEIAFALCGGTRP